MPIEDQSSEDVESTLASFYVDRELIRHVSEVSAQRLNSICYSINNEVFHYEDAEPETSYVEFELYAEPKRPKMDPDYDNYCITPSDSESEYEEESSLVLQVTLDPAPNGYIVNGACYLHWHHYHTLVPTNVSNKLLECAVCHQYIEVMASEDHVRTENHTTALQMHQPLEKFELSITRKIREYYHCGVCNEIFLNDNDHMSSKTHEGKLLSAINKVLDLVDDIEHNNNQAKHRLNSRNNNNTVNNYDNDRFINFQNDYYFDDFEEAPVFSGLSYATMAKKPKVKTEKYIDRDLGNKKVKVNFDSWHMVVSHKANRFWCMVCKTEIHARKKDEHCSEDQHILNLDRCVMVEEYEEYFIRQVDDKLYHCGHCNNLQLIHEMEDHVESNHPRKKRTIPEGTKTAANIKKPQENNTETRNRQNSMDKSPINKSPVPSTQAKNNIESPAKNKIDSPKKITFNSPPKHNLNAPKTSPPKINNNASAKNTITSTQNTIPAQNLTHSQTNLNNSEVLNTINSQAENKWLPIQFNQTSASYSLLIRSPPYIQGNNNLNSQNSENQSSVLNTPAPDLLGKIVIFPFGYKITVSFLAFNIVCKRPNDYYCGLCDAIYMENAITVHVLDTMHLRNLHETPFISPFSDNLIRAIRDALHCAICNIRITAGNIYIHLRDPNHLQLRERALRELKPLSGNVSQEPITGNFASNVNPIAQAMNTTQNIDSRQNVPPIFQVPQYKPKNLINTSTNINPNETFNFKLSTNSQSQEYNIKIEPETDKIAKNTIDLLSITQEYKDLKNTSDAPQFKPQNVDSFGNANETFSLKMATSSNSQFKMESPKTDQVSKNTPTVKQDYKESKLEAQLNDRIQEDTNNLPTNKALDEELDENSVEIEDGEWEDIDNSFDSILSEEATFDMEEYVYLKLKNIFNKVSNASYNSLVHIGDGSRYCFVCSMKVEFIQLQRHVDSRSHLENLEKLRFLDKYDDHLLRQIYLTYHCAICNVIINRKELKLHIEWPVHVERLKAMKNTKKQDIKTLKQIVVFNQKEIYYQLDTETKLNVKFNVRITKNKEKNKVNSPKNTNESKNNTTASISTNTSSNAKTAEVRKSKIIIFNDVVLKLDWDNWHGVAIIKTGYKCNLCQVDLKESDIITHCNSEWHGYSLAKPFEKQYAPALIRKINENTLNCLICNTEVSNKDHLVEIHVKGKRHLKNYEAILYKSSQANSYTDCNEDVLTI